MPPLDREAVLRETVSFNPLSRLAEFERRYPQAMLLLRIGGIHPIESTPMVNPFICRKKILDDESYANIGEHCVAVACCYSAIAGVLVSVGQLTQSDSESGMQRALIHDAAKRYGIMRKKAMGQTSIPSDPAYTLIKPTLEKQGIASELVEYMARAGSETGHNSKKDFLKINDDGEVYLVSDRLVDKIVHLSDDMTSTNIPQPDERAVTKYLTPWERMIASDFPNRYPWFWIEGIGFDLTGQPVRVDDVKNPQSNLRGVDSYAYYQVFVSNAICGEFKQTIDPKAVGPAEYFIKSLVNQTLHTD